MLSEAATMRDRAIAGLSNGGTMPLIDVYDTNFKEIASIVYSNSDTNTWWIKHLSINTDTIINFDTNINSNDYSISIYYYSIQNSGYSISFVNNSNYSKIAIFLDVDGNVIERIESTQSSFYDLDNGCLLMLDYSIENSYTVTIFNGKKIFSNTFENIIGVDWGSYQQSFTKHGSIPIYLYYADDSIELKLITFQGDIINFTEYSNTLPIVSSDSTIIAYATYNNDIYTKIDIFSETGEFISSTDISSYNINNFNIFRLYGDDRIIFIGYNNLHTTGYLVFHYDKKTNNVILQFQSNDVLKYLDYWYTSKEYSNKYSSPRNSLVISFFGDSREESFGSSYENYKFIWINENMDTFNNFTLADSSKAYLHITDLVYGKSPGIHYYRENDSEIKLGFFTDNGFVDIDTTLAVEASPSIGNITAANYGECSVIIYDIGDDRLI